MQLQPGMHDQLIGAPRRQFACTNTGVQVGYHDSAGQYTVSSTLLNDSDSNLANNETTVRGEVGGVPTDVTMTLTGTGPLQAGSLASFTARIANSGMRSASGPISVQLNSPYAGAVAGGTGWVCSSTLACTNDSPVEPHTSLPD